jgi:uncharacterized protein YndB with AHSA1/START domain
MTMPERGEMFRAPAIRFRRRLPGPIERVWELVAVPGGGLSSWYGEGGVIEGREGGQVRLEGGHVRGVVTQWRSPVKLAHTWNVFGPGDQVSPYPESYLTIELTPEGSEVLLTLVHLPVLERFEAQNAMGWATFLDILSDAAEGRPARPRPEVMRRIAEIYGVDLDNLRR